MLKLPAYVGIILKKNDLFLLVRRRDTDWMSGHWNFPGGLLEEGETLLQAAIRETQEEVGVDVEPHHFKLVHVIQVRASAKNTKDIFGFYFMAQVWEKEAMNAEPHRHSEIGWFTLDALPEHITEHALQAIEGIKNDNTYSEN